MKYLIFILLTLAIAGFSFGQVNPDLQKLVEAEHSFARMAADDGTRAAFLANMTDDAVVFVPDKANGKEFWTARAASGSLLSWAPNFADISANGMLGYTTGNWEYRAKGKTDEASAFGDFITLWLRQPDGKYKFVVDIGVGHSKPDKYSTDWVTTRDTARDLNEKNSSAADSASGFYTMARDEGMKKAYDAYAINDVRAYRENMAPILGKKQLLSVVGKDKAIYTPAKLSTFFGSADIAYNTNTYTKTVGGKIVEKGNSMQIWKLIGGKWRIVLDIFKSIS